MTPLRGDDIGDFMIFLHDFEGCDPQTCSVLCFKYFITVDTKSHQMPGCSACHGGSDGGGGVCVCSGGVTVTGMTTNASEA